MTGTEVIFDESAMAGLLESTTGPVGAHMRRIGVKGVWIAKSRAAISPDGSNGRPRGYMWSRIEWRLGNDTDGLFVDVVSPARSKDGAPYGLFVEVGTRPHEIRVHFYINGIRMFRVWDHPGTDAQPYLRPVLDDLRGA